MPSSLCFQQAAAAFQEKSINTEEYFRHLLAHFQGVRHPEDSQGPSSLNMLSIIDPVAASIKRVMVNGDVKDVRDTTPYEKLLLCCSEKTSSVEECKSHEQQLGTGSSASILLQPEAVTATKAGNSEILKYCLSAGATFDPDLDRAAQASSDPKVSTVLFEANWRNLKTDQDALDKLLISSLGKGVDLVASILDRGARILPETFARASMNPPSGADVATMSLLLERGGEPKDSGALQLAAGRGRLDIVKLLLDKGKQEVDEIPKNAPGDRMDGWPATALHEAVGGRHVDVVGCLLDHHAKTDIPNRRGETALHFAERKGYSEIVEEFAKHK